MKPSFRLRSVLLARAAMANRNYITPEDVQAEIDAGTDITALRLEVLEAIGGACGVEDVSCTASVAAEGKRT